MYVSYLAQYSNSISEEDMVKEEHGGVDSNGKKTRRRFHLFRRQKRTPVSSPSSSSSLACHQTNAAKPTNSRQSTVESEASELQDELERTELAELLMCPSKVLQTNKSAVIRPVTPVELPGGEAENASIGASGLEEMEGTTAGIKARTS